MNLHSIPYLLVSRELEMTLGSERVYVCLCLLDHLIMGMGKTREDAMHAMIREFEHKYDDVIKDVDEHDLEIDDIDFN